MAPNLFLIVGGLLSAAASILHLAAIVGGASWYRFLGAGERMARMVERGELYPTVITLGISAVLAVWSGYAFAGAGLIPHLPLMRMALVLISTVYLLRSVGYIPWLATTGAPIGAFAWISSAIVLLYAVIHIAGTVQLLRS